MFIGLRANVLAGSATRCRLHSSAQARPPATAPSPRSILNLAGCTIGLHGRRKASESSWLGPTIDPRRAHARQRSKSRFLGLAPDRGNAEPGGRTLRGGGTGRAREGLLQTLG